MAGLLPKHVQDVALTMPGTSGDEVKPSLKLSAKAARWLK